MWAQDKPDSCPQEASLLVENTIIQVTQLFVTIMLNTRRDVLVCYKAEEGV